MPEPRILLTGLAFGESPRWHDDRLWLADWGAGELTDAQVSYAATDVLHLHALRAKLDAMLAREGRADLAAACFRFLPDRVRLDLAGWAAEDIFSHSA